MHRRHSFLLFAVTVAVFLNPLALRVSAQDSTSHLSMSEAIQSALNNNKSIQLAKMDEGIAGSQYRQTEAVFLPQIVFSYSALSTNNPLYAFGFKLQEKSITANDFNPQLLNNPSTTPDFTTKLDIQQPLLNMDLLYKRKAAEKQTELYQYKTERPREYLSFEVKKAYLQLLLAYEAVKVLKEALKNAQSVYLFTENHYKQGLIQKSDVLNAQVQETMIENSLAKAKSNIRNVSDYLGLLMGQKSGVIYTADSLAQVETGTVSQFTQIMTTRSDFLAMQKAIEFSDLMIRANRMSYLPKLNAFGSYQFNDSHILGFGAGTYLAGVQLSWDIFKGNTTKNAIVTQTLERNKLSTELALQKDQSQLELNKAFRDLADARFSIRQQELAVEQAAESLLILQNRYQQGLVNTTEVLTASTQLSQQKFALAQAVFDTHVTEAYLELLTASANH
ncbi:MAG: TolC family protein [Bacteroidota bacterium]|nr:TolC family protein [Bacteroidota bacterium]